MGGEERLGLAVRGKKTLLLLQKIERNPRKKKAGKEPRGSQGDRERTTDSEKGASSGGKGKAHVGTIKKEKFQGRAPRMKKKRICSIQGTLWGGEAIEGADDFQKGKGLEATGKKRKLGPSWVPPLKKEKGQIKLKKESKSPKGGSSKRGSPSNQGRPAFFSPGQTPPTKKRGGEGKIQKNRGEKKEKNGSW